MCKLRTLSQKFFCKWINFKVRHSKKFHCPLSKIRLHYQTDWSEAKSYSPTVQLDFSWTLEMSDRQNDGFDGLSDSLRSSLTTVCTSWELYRRICFENKFSNYAFKRFHCPLSKISLRYQTVIDQSLTVFHQLFSWTSVRPSKCLIDEMIGSQGSLAIWGVLWVPCVQAENSFTELFLQMIKISN